MRKHAGARRAEVRIGERLGRRVVTRPRRRRRLRRRDVAAGQGLKNMRLRAESIEGGFALRSHPGRGTALEVVLRA